MAKNEKPKIIPKVAVKMLVKGRYADTPRDPITTVEKPGQIAEFTPDVAKLFCECGKCVMYNGKLEVGEVEKLNKDEQALADAFEMERKAKT